MDSRLTNTLLVHGASHIRYRAYTQSCQRSTCAEWLQRQHDLPPSAPMYPQTGANNESSDDLVKIYWDLVHMNIPSLWRARHGARDLDLVTLELWVFWFDDRHTGHVDAHEGLNKLQEVHVGSFSWENALAQSPTSTVAHQDLAQLQMSEKCELFIEAVRRLIKVSLASQGIFSLGDMMIYPTQKEEGDTLLCCTYHAYLSSTHLVFQPTARRAHLRPLQWQDVKLATPVLLSPSGDIAQTMPIKEVITLAVQEEALCRWSQLYHIPIEQLRNAPSKQLPLVVPVRLSQAVFLYPTNLIFVPTRPIHLLDDLWHPCRENKAWRDIKSCASLSSRKLVADAVFETLALSDREGHSGLDERTLLENALASPMPEAPMPSSQGTSHCAETEETLSLAEYTLRHFMDDHRPVETLKGTLDSPIAISQPNAPDTKDGLVYADWMPRSAPHHVAPGTSTDMQSSMSMGANMPQSDYPSMDGSYQPPNYEPDWAQNDMDIGVNNDAMEDSVWNDGFGDLDNFDLDVTEDDFKFFEAASAPGTTHTTLVTQPYIDTANLLAMDTHFGTNPMSFTTSMPPAMHIPDMMSATMPSGDLSLTDIKTLDKGTDMDMDIAPVASLVTTEVPLPPTAAPLSHPVSLNSLVSVGSSSSSSNRTTPAQERFDQPVPPEFAAIDLKGVNDSKYCDGGKFTYQPSLKSQRQNYQAPQPRLDSHLSEHNTILSPWQQHAINSSTRISKDRYQNMRRRDSTDSSTSTSSQESTSTSDSKSSSTSHPQGEVSHTLEPLDDQSVLLANWRENISHAQQDMLKRYLSDHVSASRTTKHLGQKVMDSDTLKALDYLSQQVVFGGYPFSGGVSDLVSHGGDMNEGISSAEAVLKRQAWLQENHQGLRHDPPLLGECEHIVASFKHLLVDVFRPTMDTSEQVQDESLTHMPPMIDVRGPLTVEEYHEMSEASRTNLKYGKYQVKQRRPTEPSLSTLPPPPIAVGRQDERLEGTPDMIGVWEKLRLEPYGRPKHVHYVAMMPARDMDSVQEFMTHLNTVYSVCAFGSHTAMDLVSYPRGLVPIPGTPTIEQYKTACRQLGSTLGETKPQSHAEEVHTVVYLFSPCRSIAMYLDLCRCYHTLITSYRASNVHGDTQTHSLAFQLVPMEDVLYPSAFGGYTKFGLKALAFSVYTKCDMMIHHLPVDSRLTDDGPHARLYAPPFVLAKPTPKKIKFALRAPMDAALTMLEGNVMFHLAYALDAGHRWIALVWTDDVGELVEFNVIFNAHDPNQATSAPALGPLLAKAWQRALVTSDHKGKQTSWTITKLGCIFDDELQSWKDVMKETGRQAALISANLYPTLHLGKSFAGNSADDRTPVLTPSDANLPLRPGALNEDTTELSEDRVTMMMMHHRVTYSLAREREMHGLVSPVRDSEVSMIPLATGYLIHPLPNWSGSALEQVGDETVALEFHLVAQPEKQSAYTTLWHILHRFHDLSYVNHMPSTSSHSLPMHLSLVDRLGRLVGLIDAQQ